MYIYRKYNVTLTLVFMNLFHPHQASSRCKAFSLVELLVVVGIVGVLTVAAVPAFSNLRGAGAVTRGAYDLASMLEQARTYAVANNTYVFVGLLERDGNDATRSGIGELWIAAVASKDGTKNFGANSANLMPLSKIIKYSELHLADELPSTGDLARPVVEDAFRLGNSAATAPNSFSMTQAGTAMQFTKIIQFDPRGTAKIPSSVSAIPSKMEIGLAEARGNTALSSQNCAALVVDGVTGSVRVYRP